MRQTAIVKHILLHLPYLLIAIMMARLSAVWQLAGGDVADKILKLQEIILRAVSFEQLPLTANAIIFGLLAAAAVRFGVYLRSHNSRKFRKNIEYGSARWGGTKDIKPYLHRDKWQNIILTKTESLTMDNRPADPRTARNKNVLVIGGSGSGKTRFWLKPNLMQCHSSYVITDPKGSVIVECGQLLQREGYQIRILNTINFKKSMHYNPFAYIRSEKDILKLVSALIANTKGEGKAGDDFWTKAETLLYTALIGYIFYEAPQEEQNFSTLLDMINASEVR